MQIELVFIRRPRSSFSAVFQSTFDLAEKTEPRTQMNVGVQHVALQKESVVVLWIRPPRRIAETFVPLPDLTAQRCIPVFAGAQWHVFQQIKVVGPLLRIFQVAPVLVVA